MRQRLLDECLAFGALEIDFRAVPRAFDHGVHRLVTGAFDAHDFRAHIGQHHAADRAGHDMCELDDLHAVERAFRLCHYWPFHSGVRLPRKASMPSLKSSLI